MARQLKTYSLDEIAPPPARPGRKNNLTERPIWDQKHSYRRVTKASDLVQLFTPQEVADFLQVDRETVYDLIKKGKLKAYRLGKRVLRIPVTALQKYMEELA